MDIKLLVLIVSYESKLSKCNSLLSLLPQINHSCFRNLIIWDNSQKNMCDLQLPSKCTYLFEGKNESLAKVYNKVSLNYKNEYSHLLILDDDSVLPSDFIDKVYKSVKSNLLIDLFVPKIFNNQRLVSPGKIDFIKGRLLNSVTCGINPTKDMTIISSGMCLSKRYISEHNFRIFDEKLNLYGIDTRFMKVFRKKTLNFYIFDIEIQHDTSLRTEVSVEKLAFRYNNLLRSWLIVYSDTLFEKVSIRLYVLYHILKFTLIHRSLRLISLMSGLKHDK